VCWDLSQAYAFFAYTWSVSEVRNRTLKGCRGFLFFPGVRKSAVPLAKLLAPLRGV
jgi:hypothetical protein